MFRSQLRGFTQFWQKIANIGVSEDLTFYDKKKIQVLNVVVASGILLNLFFCVLNFYQHKIWLGVINFCLLLGGWLF